jgi:hypothetical protein
MSNSINAKYRRKLSIQTFKGRGRRSVPMNDCNRPSRGEGTKADLIEFNKEKLRHRRAWQLARTPNVRVKRNGSIATGNRWTGEPHKHEREIARRPIPMRSAND